MKHTFVVLAYKESEYLETCIRSVINQTYSSEVMIVTSTPNTFIDEMAVKYNLSVVINEGKKGIGYDFDFALYAAEGLVTIAHQDDVYETTYAQRVIEAYKKNTNAIILFSDYYEIRNNQKVETNVNLKIKRILLTPLRLHSWAGSRFIKRFALRFGNAICCPAVTFNTKQIILSNVFASEFQCNIDWNGWENLSNQKGKFIFISEKLMGHRIHVESTTTEIINDNIRTREDYEMLKRFWPSFIARAINKFYKNAEKSNQE